jgi:hypothetical protein
MNKDSKFRITQHAIERLLKRMFMSIDEETIRQNILSGRDITKDEITILLRVGMYYKGQIYILSDGVLYVLKIVDNVYHLITVIPWQWIIDDYFDRIK